MFKKLATPRNALLLGGLLLVLLAVAFSWRSDQQLHVYLLDVDGHPALVQTPGGQQILIGGSNSPSGLLSALGQVLPFWDREIELVIVPQANADQLNGLLAVLDRFTVRQIMAVDVPTDSRAGREWWNVITQKGHQPIELQAAAVEPSVQLVIDGSSVLIETGDQRLSIGPSEQAQINVVAGPLDRLPQQPQLIFTWAPSFSDTRVIDLDPQGTIDLALSGEGVTVGTLR